MDRPIFPDKSQPPTDADLARVLGRCKRHWDRLVARAQQLDPAAAPEWKFYSARSGWTHVVHGERRSLLYLQPAEKRFTASFTIGERAMTAARRTGLADHIVRLIAQAPRSTQRVAAYGSK